MERRERFAGRNFQEVSPLKRQITREDIGPYADVTVDFAFKKCFGSEEYKAATIGLLNSIITSEHITDISFIRNEMQGATSGERGGVIDIICEGDDGTKFIAEMQRAGQRHFRERTSYYVSLATRDAIARGQDWEDADFQKVYVIAFLAFDLEGITGFDGDVLRHYVTIDVKRGDRMPGEPEYFFFDLKNFTKSEAELEGDAEKWLYLLRNSGTLKAFPESIEGESFRVFETASRVAAFDEKEFDEYVSAMMTQRDYNSAMKFAEEQGIEKGIKKGIEQGLERGLEQGRTEGKSEGRAERDAFWFGILREKGFTEDQIAEMSRAGASSER